MTVPEAALSGIRILDLTRLLPGPYASWMLASMGAEVVKVEGPSPGDYSRAMPPMLGRHSAMFEVLNRGKRSVAIDLKKPDGRDLLLRLVPRFDVVFEQFRPGVMERLGLGFDALKAARADVILCRLSGYGQTGPLAGAAGHDMNYQSYAGTLWLGGLAGGSPPVPALPTADLTGAMNAVTSITAALFRRERGGGAACLDISMTDSVAALAAPFVSAWRGLGEHAWQRGGALLGGGIAQYQVYECSDGGHLAVGALEPKFFGKFAALCGHPEWAQIPPLPGPWQADLKRQVAAVIATKSRDEWAELVAPLDCCVTPVLDPAEAMATGLFEARGTFASSDGGDHPAAWVDHPLGASPTEPSPGHGEQTDEILAEELGLGGEELADLRTSGVVG